MAAPAAGLPTAAPMAAPSPAPLSGPHTEPAAVFWLNAVEGSPDCVCAHCRQLASSAWNSSNDLLGPRMTAPLGPAGAGAHPAASAATTTAAVPRRTSDVREVTALTGRRSAAAPTAAAACAP